MMIKILLALAISVPCYAGLCEDLAQISPSDFLKLEKEYDEKSDNAFDDAEAMIASGDKDRALEHMRAGQYEERMLRRCVPESTKREAILLRGLQNGEISQQECRDWAPRLRIKGEVCR